MWIVPILLSCSIIPIISKSATAAAASINEPQQSGGGGVGGITCEELCYRVPYDVRLRDCLALCSEVLAEMVEVVPEGGGPEGDGLSPEDARLNPRPAVLRVGVPGGRGRVYESPLIRAVRRRPESFIRIGRSVNVDKAERRS